MHSRRARSPFRQFESTGVDTIHEQLVYIGTGVSIDAANVRRAQQAQQEGEVAAAEVQLAVAGPPAVVQPPSVRLPVPGPARPSAAFRRRRHRPAAALGLMVLVRAVHLPKSTPE